MSEVSLKEYLEKLVEARWERVEDRLNAMDRAIVLARESLEKQLDIDRNELRRRLLELNNLRESFEEKEGIFVKLVDYSPWRDGVNKVLTVLETRAAIWSLIVGVGTALVMQAVIRWLGR